MNKDLVQIEQNIEKSYAHQSDLYQFFAERASLAQIAEFMCWDGHQPAFRDFLLLWRDHVPKKIIAALDEHIAEEKGHSKLFQDFLTYIQEISGVSVVDFDEIVLNDLNYTFSPRCRDENTYGFFLGSFWATEIMSAKRCQQIYDGLMRFELQADSLEYLTVHFSVDERHGQEVLEKMILPMVEDGLDVSSVELGVSDRLHRSEKYLKWYYQSQLHMTIE